MIPKCKRSIPDSNPDLSTFGTSLAEYQLTYQIKDHGKNYYERRVYESVEHESLF